MNLNHRVIAVFRGAIQRVHCLTCGGDHKYYPPKYPRSAETERTVIRGSGKTVPEKATRSEKARKIAEKSPARAASEWNTVMKELPEGTDVRPYKVSESYRSGEFVTHPVFGTGRVLDIVGSERIQVIFRDGRKVLICNKH